MRSADGKQLHLIFYQAGDTGIDVLRVFHGARDVERLIKRIGRP